VGSGEEGERRVPPSFFVFSTALHADGGPDA
jgi:hypothetical protein